MQKTIRSLMKMAESFPNWKKTLWEKEKLLVTSNFSFSRSVFKRLVLQTRKNQGLFGKGLTHYQQYSILTHYRYIVVENIVRKGEIVCNKQLLLFSQCFLPYMILTFHFRCTLKYCLQFVSIWTSLKLILMLPNLNFRQVHQ